MRNARAALVVMVGWIGLGLVAAPAHALHGRVQLAAGGSTTNLLGTVLFVSPLLELATAITPEVGLQLQWGFTVARGSSPVDRVEGARVVSGNPTVSFPWRLAEGLVFAPGVALPAAELPDLEDPAFPIARAAVNGGRALRGTLDQWLWYAGEASFVFPVHLARWVAPFLLEADATVAYVIPVTSADPDDDFVLQAVGRAAWRVVPDLWIGATFGLVWIPTNRGDNLQTSLAPEVRWTFGAAGYVEARLLMNLDTPFGPAFQAGRVWGIHLGGGMRL